MCRKSLALRPLRSFVDLPLRGWSWLRNARDIMGISSDSSFVLIAFGVLRFAIARRRGILLAGSLLCETDGRSFVTVAAFRSELAVMATAEHINTHSQPEPQHKTDPSDHSQSRH